MFAVEERDRVRADLLRLAEADPAIVAAALTGSHAVGEGDRWSDIDLAFAVDPDEGLDAALARWTGLLYARFGALHHWDLRAGASVYRVFLLPGALEVDLSFTPAADFGPHGHRWRPVFGAAPPANPAAPDPERGRHLIGLAWHHLIHVRVCLERGRLWQAEHWIGALRHQIVALMCLRLGYPVDYAKGAHLLAPELTAPLEATLVRALDAAELRRALAAAASALDAELERADPALAATLRPALADALA